MKHLPLIVGFGGYNAAGRSSGHNGYKRMVFESLSSSQQLDTLRSLGALMGFERDAIKLEDTALRQQILQGTLVRRIESALFDVENAGLGRQGSLPASVDSPITLTMANRDLPTPLPPGWQVLSQLGGRAKVQITQPQDFLLPSSAPMAVQAAGQLPSGFDPGRYYRSMHHPRGLQLTVMAASDAVRNLGIDWSEVVRHVRPDEIGVYSASVMSQLDQTGLGGMMQSRIKGQRVTSKQLALGLNTMPADFVNAYVLGSVGMTSGVVGACATFLYNLQAAVADIESGRRKVVMVGSSEAPIVPEVIDGYAAMSALATDDNLRKLDGASSVDYRRASRPFGQNCGFTLAESGQYVILMSDDLAVDLGANIYGSVPGVFVNADGYKKSISAPGPGNYITMGKAVRLASDLLGEDAVARKSFVQAHGSSTPQNRVTESRIFDEVAAAFGIEHWPVAAVKAYLGHSLGPASGDQMAASLGVFAHGLLPGIKTIDSVADDVHASRLSISNRDQELGCANSQIAFLNSKGFGGNNATAAVFAPDATRHLLQNRYSAEQWQVYEARAEQSAAAAAEYEARASAGNLDPIYRFGEGVIDENELKLSKSELSVPGFEKPVKL